ncbi:MAG: hypothetical protein ABJM39_10755 [Porticoccus sp.]|jgi:hypothetical protein|uniref:hypothetical protein n=1 Tax=Porticoccus sp. TaxID=2024853 RepID=UPI0032982BEA|tara:strand:+ start:101 stop:277 length:177 start_codon:yes stop_codon:yes gene_type:complete
MGFANEFEQAQMVPHLVIATRSVKPATGTKRHLQSEPHQKQKAPLEQGFSDHLVAAVI